MWWWWCDEWEWYGGCECVGGCVVCEECDWGCEWWCVSGGGGVGVDGGWRRRRVDGGIAKGDRGAGGGVVELI